MNPTMNWGSPANGGWGGGIPSMDREQARQLLASGQGDPAMLSLANRTYYGGTAGLPPGAPSVAPAPAVGGAMQNYRGGPPPNPFAPSTYGAGGNGPTSFAGSGLVDKLNALQADQPRSYGPAASSFGTSKPQSQDAPAEPTATGIPGSAGSTQNQQVAQQYGPPSGGQPGMGRFGGGWNQMQKPGMMRPRAKLAGLQAY